ncbi:hypothetical protein [Paenibacillus xanthanilyticus]|uniref:Uncharacterized protein n=1 Tax=Paenibacillus xanthanilyticus TaxID=1783531 RepID=A0ABV8JW97_9BACL
MKCPSLFHFYRSYYGGASQGKVHFARAIIETGKQLENIFRSHNFHGDKQYEKREFALSLTKGFLRRFYELAEHHYGRRLFDDLHWMENRVTMSKQIVGKRELYIPFTYCAVPNENRLIFFEYGRLDDVAKWLPIFKTLIESYELQHPMPQAEFITYWDLMKGTTAELSYPKSFLAPKEQVVITARTIVEHAVRRKGRRSWDL